MSGVATPDIPKMVADELLYLVGDYIGWVRECEHPTLTETHNDSTPEEEVAQ